MQRPWGVDGPCCSAAFPQSTPIPTHSGPSFPPSQHGDIHNLPQAEPLCPHTELGRSPERPKLPWVWYAKQSQRTNGSQTGQDYPPRGGILDLTRYKCGMRKSVWSEVPGGTPWFSLTPLVWHHPQGVQVGLHQVQSLRNRLVGKECGRGRHNTTENLLGEKAENRRGDHGPTKDRLAAGER